MDILSYIIGYTSGEAANSGVVDIEGGVTCTDDGEGNVTITEEGGN